MRVIENRKGKRPGDIGVTVQFIDQARKGKTYTLTVHDITPLELYNQVKFLLKVLEQEPEVIELWTKKKQRRQSSPNNASESTPRKILKRLKECVRPNNRSAPSA